MIIKISLHFMNLLAVLLFLLLCRNTNSVIGSKKASAVISKCIYKERQALLHFKSVLEDPAGHLATWSKEDDNCCKWSRVTCSNQTGHVTSLDLSNIDGEGEFRGEISPSLLNLSFMNHLDFSHNSFYGAIPMFIGSITKLAYLDLSYNHLYGTIPVSIGSLTKLTYLDLHVNSFRGTIPKSIGFLTKLRYLSIGSDYLTGTIPKSIGSLTKLRYLYINGNFVNGTIPSELGNLTRLQDLSLIGGGVPVENLNWLSHLSDLQQLHMYGISLAKANHWVNMISGLRKLSYLGLNACNLSKVISPYSTRINSSSSIDTLSLAYNNLDSSAYSWLLPLTSNRLIDLDLSGNMLDGIPKYFGNLCSLKILYIDFNLLDAEFPDLVKNMLGCTSDSLQELNLRRSQFVGSIPDEIQKFSSLENLVVKYNRLNGTLSNKLWELPRLQFLDVHSNSLNGDTSKTTVKSSMLEYVDLSNNSFEGFFLESHLSNLPNVDHIDLSTCNLGPRFPSWIQTMKNLTDLDISDSRLSDTIPVGFWNTWPSQLRYLNLSSNNISGIVPDLLSNFDNYAAIDLSSNNFHGPIPNVPSTLASLNLSKNKFYGGISFICKIVDGFLSFLDLSRNLLTGQIPDCLWHFKELTVLNLAHNSLSGRLPASIGSLVQLEVFYLYNNSFAGELPSAMKNCMSLNFLYLGFNKFSGNVPVWIGENLSRLYVLSLRSNNFIGPIPLQLCQLVYLQVLDLSKNSLSGTIPSCINNIKAMVNEEFRQGNIHMYEPAYKSVGTYDRLGYDNSYYMDYALIMWQGNEREFSSNLALLKNIDLSSNNLNGSIPDELTDLYELLALNFSNNALTGEVPLKIGRMNKLLILDMSRNSLSGSIPSSMSRMTSLDYLDFSYNNMSGRIPSSTQLQSFGPLSYSGNVGLCGPPLTKKCPGDERPERQHLEEDVSNDDDEFPQWFYIGGGVGYAIGFWITCGVLILYRRGRYAYFHFINTLKDWIYVRVVVFVAKFRRVALSCIDPYC